ncbi:putative GPI inositol-deacylase [Scophthalmus maximus]|uniref:GPI inositol-deacylase n=1 Tax=Scophthalmus maximus TaxID=52904 RepID=A0A2U9C7Y6_SCOMX|nr:GPI inositol-deacylase [Scophthalmus maximus]XP_047193157.1 GPI inositol-deacylase [Scophthalmus maximus]AWP12711.1 putative GPI inositol-deacylase [Scophthalmus maximus]
MTLGSGAFYCVALGLLALGLRELLTGCEENRCSMTYMFEYPEYRRVALPRRVARLYPAYGLYLYGEGVYAQETRALKLTGAPVLFLPGNAGSYKQARSLGSVALRKAENMEGGLHFNVFTVDFNEELVALYGGSLLRQTHFLHESIKAILRLYKHLKNPPQSVVLVGHSMGGVVARALFTLPRFNTNLVGLILTQASPHLAPVLALDPYLLDFYSAVKQKWLKQANKLRNITVLSVGGGYRDYQVRSGLTSLPCPPGDPNKLSLVATAVPRTWVSTDHLSIVWCKELVLATVRAFFDLIDPETRQFTDDPEKKMSVLNHHFVRHPVRMVGETPDTSISTLDFPEVWSEVNTLRLAYSAPKEGQVKYFMFALSSRRKAYSHFYCRSSNLEMSSWVYGCVHKNVSSCVRAVDLSMGTELLPPYKVLILSLSDLSSVTHLVVSASNLNGRQFTVECEWQRQESHTLSVPVPHVLSFGLTVSDVTVNSSGLLHTVELQHFHQGYQAFRVNVASQCKVHKERLSNVYRIMAPWFREDSLTTVSVPSVTEISGMVHTSRPDNTSAVRLQLHTAPNCQYKVSIRTSLPRVLGQILRFCGPMVPVYTAVTLLLACGGQLSSILKSRRPADMSQVVGKGLQPHKVNLPVYVLHVLLSCSHFQEVWSTLCLPSMDVLPASFPDTTFHEGMVPVEEWPHLLSPLLYILGAAVAYWGSTVLCLIMRLVSLILAPLHRPSVSRDCGTLRPRTQLLITLCLTVIGGTSCGALSVFAAFLLHLYRVLRLQMTERSLSHMLNLAPRKHNEAANGTVDADSLSRSKECNGAPLLSECAVQEVRDDLQLHLCLSALFTLPVMLSAPSLLHWIRNLRYSTQLDPDPCWPYVVPLVTVYILLINCNTLKLCSSKLLPLTSCLPLPLAVTMVAFSPLHLYRVTYFLLLTLVPLASCCLL